MNRGPRLRVAELHWPLIGVVVAIALLGIYNLHSAAAARDANLYLMQALWMGVAAVGIGVFLLLDYRITEALAYPIFGIVVVLLLAVLGQGKAAKGAARWLALGPMTFQPSELAKLATVMCLARFFSHRFVPGGYSLEMLLKPLNPSRPLAVVGALAVFWGKPWLVDPVGELARLLRTRLGESPPVPGNLWWFRAFLILALAALALVAVVIILRWEKQVALLAPWPPGRRRRFILAALVLCAALGGVLAWKWHAPALRDPFGVTVAHLWAGAAPGGPYARLAPHFGLRLLFASLAALYLAASVFAMRQGVSSLSTVLIAPIDLLALPAGLILVQPDLGTAGVVILIGATMLLIVGVRLRSLIILGVFGAMIAGVGWFGVLKKYQRDRITTFMDPEHDTQGAGWNAVQSMIAVGSGRWVGKGHKGGTQTQLSFLPEQHTDFAFSVWGEEMGFLGAGLLVALYAALIMLGLMVAADAREHYGGLLAAGATAIILWQALINMSMVIGLFPVVGITLPLFSYGGSSVLTVLGAVGILLNVHWRRRAH